MKILLICFLAVQVKAVFCTYRRHVQSARNSASFLLRKVCVEVAGLKQDVAGFKGENVELKAEVAGLKEENLGLKEKLAGLEEAVAGSKQAGKPICDE